ncbi:LLM class flavin-dependent oxidoreductase [Actinomadura madurae]|uniref:LLM class flavin-dependent oxidoreductase n=1 Tax=Actinomadura madurae TaxID=1993 RepID=UPI002025C423|nr:LLM class flavin-dependent oxidoreductase [Actinomadura madurae]MCP9951567.1 LLM class flavin-dependent oxidoreductase [Actinomadura madurae]MCP9968338.1 LLM class flavin-dependent oxidoreductase [Actinomadura madurae]MCQ0007698.1 LLM class flavin-dependent oxidoreductase [Actinomadura madurae]MCQ0016998.1 LLM class flavin-dependent oxidoreductase [Actinomadura madurae]URM97446.1 LLM class flavin-dependent oxidoreductase [Actinomadura madurae]
MTRPENAPAPRRVRFGMAATDVATLPETARSIEDLGYDYLAVGEHLFFHVPTPNALTALSAAAVLTSRIELLSGVLQLPLYPAPLLAKMGAVIDVLSNGRFNLGVGVAGEEPREFEACGIPVNSRGARSDDALDVVTRLWTQKSVSREGPYGTLRDVTLDPAPVRRPHPPIWVSGRKTPAIRRAARFAQWWMPYMYTPERFAASLTELRSLSTAAGRGPDAVRPALFAFVSCHADRDRAVDQAVRRLSAQYDQDFSQLTEKYVLAGNPDDCAAKISRFVEAGAETVILVPIGEERDFADMRALLSAEVLPAFA